MQMWKVTTSEIISRAFLTESSTPWAMATPMLDPALAGLTCKPTNVRHDSIFKILACSIQRKSIDILPLLFLYPCLTSCYQTTLLVQICQLGFPGPIGPKLR